MSSSVPFVYFLVYQIAHAHTIHILQYHDVGWKRAMGFPGKHNWKLAHSASAALLKLCPHSLLFFIFSKNVKTQIIKHNWKLLIISYHAVFYLYIHLVAFNCPLLSIVRMVSFPEHCAFWFWVVHANGTKADEAIQINVFKASWKQTIQKCLSWSHCIDSTLLKNINIRKYQLNSFHLKSVVKINNKRKQLTNFELVSSTVRVASFNFFIQIWTT